MGQGESTCTAPPLNSSSMAAATSPPDRVGDDTFRHSRRVVFFPRSAMRESWGVFR
jgi:hypothetical protein